MLQTYEGTLRGNRIDWVGDPPKSNLPVRVFVTVLSEERERPQSSSQEAVAILQTLSQTNPFADITDPIQWQNETRQERQLPGRV